MKAKAIRECSECDAISLSALNRRRFLQFSAALGAAAGLSEVSTRLDPAWAGTALNSRQEAARFLALFE